MGGVFITGTDTGVGKTWIGTALAYCLAVKYGLVVRPRKPVESGCLSNAGKLLPSDAAALQAAANASEPLEQVCPYRLQAALSPERAALLEGVEIDLGKLAAACVNGISQGDFLLVEGAGGFFSPLAAGVLNADLAAILRLPVLLVAADRLGAINHTLLTLQAIEQRGLTLAGLILNQPARFVEEKMDNAADLERWSGRSVTVVPHWAGNAPVWSQTANFLEEIAKGLV
jgi:dethiobiotin synthetase